MGDMNLVGMEAPAYQLFSCRLSQGDEWGIFVERWRDVNLESASERCKSPRK
jgi:hypothetical protein